MPSPRAATEESAAAQAAALMAGLRRALGAGGRRGGDLQAYAARLLFCLFAGDAGVLPRGGLRRCVEESREDGSDLDARLAELFRAMGGAGGLFRGGPRPAAIDKRTRRALLDCLSFDWGRISPAALGPMLQGAADGRRETGAHYTSEENILKLIDPLFMDGLRAGLREAAASGRRALAEFHDGLAALRFLDPACGCGNFLMVAYRELRRLELDVVRAKGAPPGARAELKVAAGQFHGIEILPWPCRLARAGMWLVDRLMDAEASIALGGPPARPPSARGAAIVEGNALRVDWSDVVPRGELDYIMGNPPFIGCSRQSREQKADMLSVCVGGDGRPVKNAGKMDYAAAWHHRAAAFAQGAGVRCAFVSTDSITQGEQAAAVWRPLFETFGMHIDFARRAFKWSGEAGGGAQVQCVMVGFSAALGAERFICDGDARTAARNINAYLADGPDAWIEARRRPVCGAPAMARGSDPIDGGNLIIEADEYGDFIAREPRAARFVRPFMMGEEFIAGKKRWCLWLAGADPDELGGMPLVMERVARCREYRAASRRGATRKGADTPALFCEIRQPASAYMAVPKVSSDARRYIPIGFLPGDVIAGDKLFTVQGASLWHFGVLTSGVHMAWTRATCGRIGIGYSYSSTVVYNNFPWPRATGGQRGAVAALARAVLDARALFPGASLADLYGPRAMPPELSEAHGALDRAVMELYGFAGGAGEAEVAAGLMERRAGLAGGPGGARSGGRRREPREGASPES